MSSVLKTHYLSDPPSCSVVGFYLDFERGFLAPFGTLNYHDDKMYNTVVPPTILYIKGIQKG